MLRDLAVNIIHHCGGGAKIPGFRSPEATKFLLEWRLVSLDAHCGS